MQDTSSDTIIEAAKSAPPAIVTAMHLGGLSLADWVAILTMLYLALQIGLLLPRYLEKLRNWQQKKKSPKDASK